VVDQAAIPVVVVISTTAAPEVEEAIRLMAEVTEVEVRVILGHFTLTGTI
jgi:hypothetical protein